MTYDIDYFIAKFEAIPDERWTVGDYTEGQDKCCALGHCGERSISGITEESAALSELLMDHDLLVTTINDFGLAQYKQPTPKARILAALRDIKAKA